MARKKEIDRDRILDAAEAVIVENGGRHFVLDAVAERAGISKGGLIYSFPTKDELIAVALDRELARFQAGVANRSAGGSNADVLLGHLDQALAETDALIRKAAFLMTALIHAPALSKPAHKFYEALFALFDPSTPEGRDARQAALAVEGLFLLRGMGLVDVSAEDWQSTLGHARETMLRCLSRCE